MATALKVLGYTTGAQTATTLYTVPANTQTAISTINVCNLNNLSNTFFRIAVRPAGAALANGMYLAYDTPLGAADSIAMTMGITMGNTDILSVSSTSGNVRSEEHTSELQSH